MNNLKEEFYDVGKTILSNDYYSYNKDKETNISMDLSLLKTVDLFEDSETNQHYKSYAIAGDKRKYLSET